MHRFFLTRAVRLHPPLLRSASLSTWTLPQRHSGLQRRIWMATGAAVTCTVAYAMTLPSMCYADSLQHQTNPPSCGRPTLPSPSATVAELLDDNSRAVFHLKSTEDLLVGMVVHRLCTLPGLVALAPTLFHVANVLHIQGPLHWIAKHSVFRHFCGGETPEECMASIDGLARSGIRSILDFSVEADYASDYDDSKADAVVGMLKQCCVTAAASQSGNLAAVKVTALGPPDLLFRLNTILLRTNAVFDMYKTGNNAIDRHGLDCLIDQIVPPPRDAEQSAERQRLIDSVFSKHDRTMTMTRLDVAKLLSFDGPHCRTWWWSEDTRSSSSSSSNSNSIDLAAYDRMVRRLDQVCQTAHEHHVGIMIDAEQSYFQEAIDHVAMDLMAKYNRATDRPPTIYNTYQMYTKASQHKLERDVSRAQADHFQFAAKLVRGAYMVTERKRAAELGYPSPIHDTINDTHQSFNNGVRFLLDKHSSKTSVVFMVATHNRDSIVLAVQEMERHNVKPQEGVVHFGQLYGMQDQISYTLGKNGYSIYKYLPYGKIGQVMPYLLRRAQENSNILGGANKEMLLLWQELKARWTGSTKNTIPIIPAPGLPGITPSSTATAAVAAAAAVAVADMAVDNAETTVTTGSN